MNARARASIFSISLLGAIFALSTPAWAPGTLGLDEVLAAVKTEPKLVAEIERELKKDGRKADRLTCMGARHGNQWKYLGGARAAPYSCVIGQREITIEADRAYFDAEGQNLGDVEHASFDEAKTFRETNFRWTWTAAGAGR
jgi:hypothetical protein